MYCSLCTAAMSALVAFGEQAGCSYTASGELSDSELEAVAGGMGSGSGSGRGYHSGSGSGLGHGLGGGMGHGSGSGPGSGRGSFAHSRS